MGGGGGGLWVPSLHRLDISEPTPHASKLMWIVPMAPWKRFSCQPQGCLEPHGPELPRNEVNFCPCDETPFISQSTRPKIQIASVSGSAQPPSQPKGGGYSSHREGRGRAFPLISPRAIWAIWLIPARANTENPGHFSVDECRLPGPVARSKRPPEAPRLC